MQHTNYYTVPKKEMTFDPTFIKKVNTIFTLAEKHFEIDLSGHDGLGEPHITKDMICFNGEGRQAHEPFAIYLNEPRAAGDNFCKTAEKPYDAVVKAVLKLAQKEGYVTNVSADYIVPESETICQQLLANVQ